MIRFFTLFLLLITANAYADEIYSGKNCHIYAESAAFIENNRDNGVKKEEMFQKILSSTAKEDLKQIFYKNINFLYNNKHIKGYGKSLRRACQEKGFIKFTVVKNVSNNQAREEL